MKKTILLILLFFSISALIPQTSTAIDINILENKGLTKYTSNNYTFDCEEANSNILTISVEQSVGYTYVSIAKLTEGYWIEGDYHLLDKYESFYNVQFDTEGTYRIRAIRDYQGNSTYEDYFIDVRGGSGVFIVGDVEDLMDKGRWVNQMMEEYREYCGDTFIEFQEFSVKAARWIINPGYMVVDFLLEVPMVLMLPHTYVVIGIVAALIIWRYGARIKTTRREREISREHGNRSNLIMQKRKAEENERLHKLNTMSIDYALELRGGGDWLSRSYAYCSGVRELGVNYPSAYALAFELGGALFSRDEARRRRGEEIINALVEEHEPVLEKAFIYQDIAACARAISAESVEGKARPIIRDDFIKIAELAEDSAKKETEALSKKLKIQVEKQESLSDSLKKVETQVSKGAKKVGKDTKPQ